MNKKLATIDIRGKKYVLVKDRLLAFAELYPKGSITTEIIKNEGEVVFKATVYPDTGIDRVFTGHSEAIRGVSAGITGQSPIEVAETSAVGRALAMLGIGIIESVASADEINKPKWSNDTYVHPDTGNPAKAQISPNNSTSKTPFCSICGELMKPTKAGSRTPYFCKHGEEWGKPVFEEKKMSKHEEEFVKELEEDEEASGITYSESLNK